MKRNVILMLATLLALSLFSCKKELTEGLVAKDSERIAEAREMLKTPEEINFLILITYLLQTLIFARNYRFAMKNKIILCWR
ncbi:MAG: hypothetical protein SGI94_17615 [Saprospiraceae bacterium]|nr:hypothetical protein [Saprospiraceae bacterium]